MTTYDTVILETKDGVARVTMNRPESLNSLSSHLLNDLFYSLDEVRLDPAVRAVVLTGAGRGFCSGADISPTTNVRAPPASAVARVASRPGCPGPASSATICE